MAGSTTNLGLIKPLGTEKIRIAQINQNSDTLDAAIGAVGSTSLQAQVGAIEDGIAIVANGDSHVAITAGQFVYVKNNTHNLAEGLYVASANVSANGSITSSNMTADASGGLNALNAKINTIYPDITATKSSGSLLDVTPGVYRYSSDCTDKPDSSSGYLWFTKRNDGLKNAIAISDSNAMFYNLNINGWYGWKEITTFSSFKRLTSTTSFQSIDPQNTSRSDYMGGTLDAKVHAQISTFTTDATTPFCFSNGGPVYGGFLTKTNNNYYSGIVYSYHDSAKYSVWYFAYTNGTYHLRPCSPVL